MRKRALALLACLVTGSALGCAGDWQTPGAPGSFYDTLTAFNTVVQNNAGLTADQKLGRKLGIQYMGFNDSIVAYGGSL